MLAYNIRETDGNKRGRVGPVREHNKQKTLHNRPMTRSTPRTLMLSLLSIKPTQSKDVNKQKQKLLNKLKLDRA